MCSTVHYKFLLQITVYFQSEKLEYKKSITDAQINDRVTYTTHGCGCGKTTCSSERCICFKANRYCAPGCSCLDANCENRPIITQTEVLAEGSDEDDERQRCQPLFIEIREGTASNARGVAENARLQ